MKLNPTQLAVLRAIRTAKNATKAQAFADGGNHVTLTKLIEMKLVEMVAPTKKQPLQTIALTTTGKDELKRIDKELAAKAKYEAKLAAAQPAPALA